MILIQNRLNNYPSGPTSTPTHRTAAALLDRELAAYRQQKQVLELRLMGVRLSVLRDKPAATSTNTIRAFLNRPSALVSNKPDSATEALPAIESVNPTADPPPADAPLSQFNDEPDIVEISRVSCPVCGVYLPADNNAAVNSHIDLCLNTSTLLPLEEQRAGPVASAASASVASGKTRRQQPAHGASKRKPSDAAAGAPPLDQWFRAHQSAGGGSF